jgi:hypothetical protein
LLEFIEGLRSRDIAFQSLGDAGLPRVEIKLLGDLDVTVKEVGASLTVNRATIYRALGIGAAGRKSTAR